MASAASCRNRSSTPLPARRPPDSSPSTFFIQQPQDWLWPNRIPLGKLTLIAGYPSSGKTSIALDVAARVSRGAPAPDQPDAPFPSAPVVLALLDDNPKADVLPVLRLFGADLGRVYLADLLSPTHPVDYYPDDPPDEDDGPDYPDDDDYPGDDDDWDDDEDDFADLRDTPLPRRRKPVGIKVPARDPFGPPPDSGSKLTAPWPRLDKIMGRLANLIAMGNAALLVVDQVEDLAAMHRARLTTVLGMLKALAARSGAAVIALTHNPASNYPRAVTAMHHRLAHASVVFTTAVVEPGGRRFLVPLRPAMSDDAPAIPFVLPPGRVIPAEAGIQSSPSDGFAVAWRKPVFPAHLRALPTPSAATEPGPAPRRRSSCERSRTAPAPLPPSNAKPPCKAYLGVPSSAPALCVTSGPPASAYPAARMAQASGTGRCSRRPPCNRMQHLMDPQTFENVGTLALLVAGSRPRPCKHPQPRVPRVPNGVAIALVRSVLRVPSEARVGILNRALSHSGPLAETHQNVDPLSRWGYLLQVSVRRRAQPETHEGR